MRIIALIIFSFSLASCGFQRTYVAQKSAADFRTVHSYYSAPFRLGPTLASSSQISSQINLLEKELQELLSDKGLRLTSAKSADSRVLLAIEASLNQPIAEEEVRFLKGAHGSNFPHSNPRITNLESDYLKLDIIVLKNNKNIYSAKCKLIPNQDAVRSRGVEIKLSDARQCLRDLVSRFP